MPDGMDGLGKSSVPPLYKDFCCPICGSRGYEQVAEHNGIYGPGGRAWLKYNRCCGCSVQFGDPEKFTKAGSQVK